MSSKLFVLSVALFSFGLTSCAIPTERTPQGMGLTRDSFGKLNPQKLEPRFSLCNNNTPISTNQTLHEGLSKILDPTRNATSKADETLAKEELVHHFPFVAVMGQPVVRVIHRDDESIDFWFKNDATIQSYHAEQAAEEYCRSRDKRTAKYVGFSFTCGDPISPIPITINGQKTIIIEEERILAYNCINPAITPTPTSQPNPATTTTLQSKSTSSTSSLKLPQKK